MPSFPQFNTHEVTVIPIKLPAREGVIALCPWRDFPNAGVVYDDHVWIKYGVYLTLGEAAVQRHVYQRADPRIVRVPKVYDAFSGPLESRRFLTYIVMENIQADNYVPKNPEAAEQALEAIERALCHIWELPLPENTPVLLSLSIFRTSQCLPFGGVAHRSRRMTTNLSTVSEKLPVLSITPVIYSTKLGAKEQVVSIT